MPIPLDFNPLGKDLRLPYLPVNLPFRNNVIDGVYNGKLCSTGSLGIDEATPLNPKRYLYQTPFIEECLNSPFMMVVRKSDGDSVICAYNNEGLDWGGYQTGSFGVFDKINEYNMDIVVYQSDYALSPTLLFAKIINDKSVTTNTNILRIIPQSPLPPERANKLLITTTAKAALFFDRVLTDEEIIRIRNWIRMD